MKKRINRIDLFQHNGYSEKFRDRLIQGRLRHYQELNRRPESSVNINFDSSWLKSHDSPSHIANRAKKKKLSFFIDTILTYDFKKRLNKRAEDEKVIEHKPKLEEFQSRSDSTSRPPELEISVVEKVDEGNNEAEKETKSRNAELLFENYITETWDKYRKLYEHLGEKSPFINEPPTAEFLLNKFNPDEQDQTSDEELDFQGESHSESEEIVNNNDSFMRNENGTQLADDLNEDEIHDGKQYAERYTEDKVIEPFNKNCEMNYQTSKDNNLSSAVPDVRTLSTNVANYFPKLKRQDNIKDLEFQLPRRALQNSTKVFQKQHTVKPSSYEPVRPLVNPYIVPSTGSATMLPQPNIYQPYGTPYNYWMARPPFNQFQMFQYGFPWQTLPFASPYFYPLYQHSVAPIPYVGSPWAGQLNISPPPPAGATSPGAPGLLNVPYTEVPGGPGSLSRGHSIPKEVPLNGTDYSKHSYVHANSENRQFRTQFQKPGFNSFPSGQQAQRYQNFHQRHKLNSAPNPNQKYDRYWTPEYILSNSENSRHYEKPSTNQYNPPDLRRNSFSTSTSDRSHPSTSNLKMQGNHSSLASSKLWLRENPPPEPYWSRPLADPPPLSPSPPRHRLQQGMNNHIQNYSSLTDEHENRVRSENEIPSHQLGEQQDPYLSTWYSGSPRDEERLYPT